MVCHAEGSRANEARALRHEALKLAAGVQHAQGSCDHMCRRPCASTASFRHSPKACAEKNRCHQASRTELAALSTALGILSPLFLRLTASRLAGLRRALHSLCPDPTWLSSLAFSCTFAFAPQPPPSQSTFTPSEWCFTSVSRLRALTLIVKPQRSSDVGRSRV